jgi:hypothetical protein
MNGTKVSTLGICKRSTPSLSLSLSRTHTRAHTSRNKPSLMVQDNNTRQVLSMVPGATCSATTGTRDHDLNPHTALGYADMHALTIPSSTVAFLHYIVVNSVRGSYR